MKEPDEDSPVENTVQPVEEMEITEEEHSGPENGIMTGPEVQVSDELEQAEEESKPIQEILDPDMVATRSIFTRKTRS
jgi:hypothetical protein